MRRFLDRLEQRLADVGRVICHAALNDPIPPEWDQYVTQSPIALEVVQDVLFDTLTYTSASTTELIFFAQSLASVKKDITNMAQPGMLPNPESFLIMAPRLYVKWAPTFATTVAASTISDLVQLVNTSIILFTFGNKKYGPFPAWMFSAGSYPDMRMTGAGAEATNKYLTYGQIGGPLFAFFPNCMISPLQNFNVTMSWPSGAVTLGAGNPAISWVLEGQRARAVQ